LNQDYKGAKEIIVVNDGSTDRTAAIAAQYPIILLDLKQNVGKASALNEGIKISKGDIILFTDGDSNMCIDAVSSMVKCFSAHPNADIVTGQVLINKPEKFSFINRCQMIEYHIEQEIVRYLQSLTDEIVVCPGPITAVKRRVCDQVPYTNDTILEDADFSASARENRFMIKLDPYAKIYTNAPETIKQWYKQRTRWWYGNLQVWRIHKKWAIKNPWMIYSYLSFVTSLCSLVMMLVMPYFMIQYGSIDSFVVKGLICFSILMLMNSAMISIFFRHNKMLMLMVFPYMIVYPILKVFVLSYFYVLYITGIGLNIKHGTRHIKAK
jgi:cellulose synthase/poly-beta-1,6-N-acetylglucosamine synthase-like glycosyltransferase